MDINSNYTMKLEKLAQHETSKPFIEPFQAFSSQLMLSERKILE